MQPRLLTVSEPNDSNLSETRTERVADMENKLLDDGLIRDLNKQAKTEETGSEGA